MFGISGYVMGGMAAVIAALVVVIGIQWKLNSVTRSTAAVDRQEKLLYKEAYVKLLTAVKEHNKVCDVIPPIVPDDEVKPDGGRRRIFPWLRSDKLQEELYNELGDNLGMVSESVPSGKVITDN